MLILLVRSNKYYGEQFGFTCLVLHAVFCMHRFACIVWFSLFCMHRFACIVLQALFRMHRLVFFILNASFCMHRFLYIASHSSFCYAPFLIHCFMCTNISVSKGCGLLTFYYLCKREGNRHIIDLLMFVYISNITADGNKNMRICLRSSSIKVAD